MGTADEERKILFHPKRQLLVDMHQTFANVLSAGANWSTSRGDIHVMRARAIAGKTREQAIPGLRARRPERPINEDRI
jgi:hypothetical protein